MTISIQNVCPPIPNRINSDLQPLILDATRLKDEALEEKEPLETTAAKPETPAKAPASKPPKPSKAVQDPIGRIRAAVEDNVGSRSGLEDIYKDKSWDGAVRQWSKIGSIFDSGELLLCYVDRGEAADYIVVPGGDTLVLSVSPKCPRDKIMNVLRKL